VVDTLAKVGDGTNIRAGIPFDQIVSIMRQRRSQQSALITQMIDIRDRYNGDVVLPVPDVDKSPTMDPPVPRLIAQAVDGTALRAASPAPTIVCPILDPTSVRSIERASTRRKMLYARWHTSQVKIKLYRSYRHLVGYGTCAWLVMPDDEAGHARIELRDPLTSYPELRSPDDIRDPINVGFIFGRSIDWITKNYPESAGFFYNAAAKNWDTLWDVVEWIDRDEIVVGILGPRMPAYQPNDAQPYGYNGFELRRWKNKAGMVPMVMPQRVTLDRIQGQMSTMIDTVDLHTRMTALEVLAAERHVFPDLVIMGEANQQPQLVNGNWRDGRTGEANLVSGARSVQYLSTQMPPAIPAVVEQLEQAIRETGGASGMFGGQNPGGLRTGRALDSMGSFSIDPRVEEAQRLQEKALGVVNSAVIAVEKGYYPGHKFWSFTGLQGDEAMVEYCPSKDLDSGENAVQYPIPGADISQLSVAVSQLVGSQLMSKRTGRVKHPFIDDAELEEELIDEEQMRTALLQGLSQQLVQGAMPPRDAARVIQLLRSKKTLEDAVMQAQEEAQARQATQAPPPGPGQAAAPQTMPGLGPPGQGAEQPPGPGGPPGGGQPPIPMPPASLANFHALVRNLNSNPVTPSTGGPPV
jgi:hypothetical protein